MKRIIYLDANATQPLRPSAGDILYQAATWVGNPSSTHCLGRHVRAKLEHARETLAHCAQGAPINCIFTSGGTEANALAMHGLGQGRHFLVGRTEHDAVRKNVPAADFFDELDVDAQGRVKLDVLEGHLKRWGREAFVSLMAANNETGVIHPLREIGALTQKYGAHFHCDAVQGLGRLPLAMGEMGIDSLACSGHKLGGAKGAGALLLRQETFQRIEPLYEGGGQEMGRRSGTPPVPAILSMVAALEEEMASEDDFSSWRDKIDERARAVGAVVCGGGATRLGHTTCLAVPGFSAQSQLMQLDLQGICISTGSACSSGTTRPSHVLTAMGLEKLASCFIRVSLPWNVKAAEVDQFIYHYCAMVKRYFDAKR